MPWTVLGLFPHNSVPKSFVFAARSCNSDRLTSKFSRIVTAMARSCLFMTPLLENLRIFEISLYTPQCPPYADDLVNHWLLVISLFIFDLFPPWPSRFPCWLLQERKRYNFWCRFHHTNHLLWFRLRFWLYFGNFDHLLPMLLKLLYALQLQRPVVILPLVYFLLLVIWCRLL